ncbi:MAG: SDR family oxidoreductase [Candidatus Cyclobacteriaceae bacterium M2_1C_046]
MTKIQNRVIWITGASSGIGEKLSYQLAKKGARLILSARRENELLQVKNNCIAKNPDDIKILPFDLSFTTLHKQTVDLALQLFGHIDVLVNNGGISQRSLARDTELDVYRRLMEVNYFGSVALTQHLLPHFIDRKEGHFVAVTSIVGKIGSPYRSGYAASKHALHGYYDSLRAEHHQDNIRVSLICPGWTNTDVSKNALTGDGKALGQTFRFTIY